MSTVGNYRGPNIVKDGLVLYLDAATANSYNRYISPTIWKDISDNGNNGTLTGGVTYDSGNSGSLLFNGSTGYVSKSNPPSSLINWYSQNYTIQCWFNATTLTATANGGSSLCGNADPSTNAEYWSFGPSSNGKIKLYFYSGTVNVINSNSTVLTNSWYNITFTKNSTTLTIYINGISDISTTLTVTPQSSPSYPFIIGSVANGKFNGKISNIQIYNRALSSTEIYQLYNK